MPSRLSLIFFQIVVVGGVNPNGFKVWSEAEIEIFEEKHPLGTKARPAMDLYGWMTLEQAEVYTREADRQQLSREGVQFLQ